MSVVSVSIPESPGGASNIEPSATSRCFSRICSGLSKICKVGWQATVKVTSIATRFFGSKHGYECDQKESSYHNWDTIPLPLEKARGIFKYAAVPASLFLNDPEWVKPFGFKPVDAASLAIRDLPVKTECTNGNFLNKDVGLKCRIVENEHEVVVAFGSHYSASVDFGENNKAHKIFLLTQFFGAVLNLVGVAPDLFDAADELFVLLKNHPNFRGKKIVLAGNCAGGALAQYVGLQNGCSVYCFNSMPLGAGLQQKLGKEKIRRAKDLVTHVSAKGDCVSLNSIPPLGLLDRVFSTVITTPGNFGTRYMVESAFKDRCCHQCSETHDRFLDSFRVHLGYPKDKHPKDLSPEELRKWFGAESAEADAKYRDGIKVVPAGK